MSLRGWLRYHQRDVVFGPSTWMGVPAQKNPMDAWIYQEIIHRVRPDTIVEIGSASGGSTLYYCHLLDLLDKPGKVISVDIDRSAFQAEHERIVVITGDSTAPETFERVKEHVADGPTLVIQDGDHERGAVLRDLQLYGPLVTVGSYLIVEDGVIDQFHAGDGIGWSLEGPMPAVDDFLAEHPHFVVDEECERYLLTYNPRGFLRRVS